MGPASAQPHARCSRASWSRCRSPRWTSGRPVCGPSTSRATTFCSMADDLGNASRSSPLVAGAAFSERLPLSVQVLNNEFWTPAACPPPPPPADPHGGPLRLDVGGGARRGRVRRGRARSRLPEPADRSGAASASAWSAPRSRGGTIDVEATDGLEKRRREACGRRVPVAGHRWTAPVALSAATGGRKQADIVGVSPGSTTWWGPGGRTGFSHFTWRASPTTASPTSAATLCEVRRDPVGVLVRRRCGAPMTAGRGWFALAPGDDRGRRGVRPTARSCFSARMSGARPRSPGCGANQLGVTDADDVRDGRRGDVGDPRRRRPASRAERQARVRRARRPAAGRGRCGCRARRRTRRDGVHAVHRGRDDAGVALEARLDGVGCRPWNVMQARRVAVDLDLEALALGPNVHAGSRCSSPMNQLTRSGDDGSPSTVPAR